MAFLKTSRNPLYLSWSINCGLIRIDLEKLFLIFVIIESISWAECPSYYAKKKLINFG